MRERLALPLIGQITQSPTELAAREHAPVFIRRLGDDDDMPNAGLSAPRVFATTETAALQEYDSNLRRVGELVERIHGYEKAGGTKNRDRDRSAPAVFIEVIRTLPGKIRGNHVHHNCDETLHVIAGEICCVNTASMF